ncbi:MAG: dioxygenase family protein [Bdellovibrionales bacterium]
MQANLKRRHFLQWGITGLGAAMLSLKASAAPKCAETPPQTAGPFYPGQDKFALENDLTVVRGATAKPLGQVVYIQGVVQDENCLPLAGATVEIWQACASGRYNNDTDTNTAALDPNFKYWGETVSAADGTYEFKTIVPGAYPADTDWDRPPHIHFKLSKRGYHELITQMYWKGHPLNNVDKILLNVPKQLRDDVIVDFQTNPADPTTQVGHFPITMLKVR